MKWTIAGIGLVAILAFLTAPAPAADEGKCVAPDGWFPVTPKPTNAKPDPDQDCDFYKWAWQTFLYLTQEEPGGKGLPRFITYANPEDIFPADSTPRFARGPKGDFSLAPRLAKVPDAVKLQEFLQADSKGVLVDRNGRVVYYAIHINDEFVKFIDNNKFRNVDNIAKAPADLEFPRGCLELKSSWKVMGPGDDRSKFFTKTIDLSSITLKAGKPTIDPSRTVSANMGLVGLHVVGVVDGHPEFIWATFEHNDNAPDLDPKNPDPNDHRPVDNTRDYTFYPKGTPAVECNRKKALTFKSEADQTFQPSIPIFRQYPFGGETKEDEAITTLNASVADSITRLAPGLSVWKNYRLTGAVWLNNTAYFREGADFAVEDENHPENKILGGERKLSNTTMETFTQVGKVNCFKCHKTTGEFFNSGTGPQAFPAKRIGVSHVLTNAYINAKQAGK